MSFRERLTDRDVFELRCTGALVLVFLVGACAVVAVARGEIAWALGGGSLATFAVSVLYHAHYEGSRSAAPDVRAWCRRVLGMPTVEAENAAAEVLWRARVEAFLRELERASEDERTIVSAHTPHFQGVWCEKGASSVQ